MASTQPRHHRYAGRPGGLRQWLAGQLIAWGTALSGRASQPALAGAPAEPGGRLAKLPTESGALTSHDAAGEPPVLAFCPGLREPLSVEDAVLRRDLSLLKREAADALAALGSAHALVASARLAEVQSLRERLRDGEDGGDRLMALAGDYQGWQADQVRLFDALALVMRMRVPSGRTLEQVDPGLHNEARRHLESLSVEYQRMLLSEQMGGTSAER
ncbi:MAG: hypothetical protein VKO65_02645 [Cyanobacteriota bacterium]|nr:hypothetical protein [Cyanobacteriota bacterium]